MKQADTVNIPSFIMEGVNKTLAADMPNAGSTELEQHRKQMSKAQFMDSYLASFTGELTGAVIRDVVLHIFGMDLDNVSLLTEGKGETASAVLGREQESCPDDGSLSRNAINPQLAAYGRRMTGPEIRSMLNDLFGVNLDAISALEKAKISLFSKGQWVVKHDHDLFVVYTGAGDVDVTVYPTFYFTERTGMSGLPEDLKHALIQLGYCDKQHGDRSLYYTSPDGQAIPDAFKGQTMGAIMATIRSFYAHL
ncbi:hypothetical protein [Paenibacillus sp.]|jgi:hypothetical protein|uniref:hypothetical protein n=1 Tax=Paenibacillus sp. TaxID=58172 RepID=UPI002827D8DE|nr:hypothetical protein [Paenibacillus sp.]MDR0269654.1 hypothetical protein [Paenibacillus sp.]